MIRRLDAATEAFLTDLAEVNRRVDKAQRELGTGRRVNRPSDAPDEISSLLQMRSELAQTERIRFNLERVKTEVDTAEQTLQDAIRVLDRAAVLGAQGVNGTTTPEQRRMIAEEVETLLEQMVVLGRARVEGRYIFSGDADGQAPYTLDLSQEDPVSDYLGGPTSREIMHPAGTSFPVAKTAEEIFDNPNPNKNVFQALNNLRLALRNDDEPGIRGAIGQLETAADHLNEQLAFYGSVQNQVAEAIDFAHQHELRIKNHISTIQDTDVTQAVLELNQATYQRQVALGSKAKSQKISLFDYIS